MWRVDEERTLVQFPGLPLVESSGDLDLGTEKADLLRSLLKWRKGEEEAGCNRTNNTLNTGSSSGLTQLHLTSWIFCCVVIGREFMHMHEMIRPDNRTSSGEIKQTENLARKCDRRTDTCVK